MLFFASFYAKRFKIIFLVFALSFYLLSNTFVSNFLLSPLEKPFNKSIDTNTSPIAVVILGGGDIPGSANLSLGNDAFKRAIYGLMLAKSKNLPVLFSGGGLNKKHSEADSFMDSAKEISKSLDISMPISNNFHLGNFFLHVEAKSLNTFENAKFSKEKFKALGILKPTIYLVTSAYHMKRSMLLYKHFGFKVIPAATDFKIAHKPSTIWDYFPNVNSFNKSYIALHEYFGVLSLKLRGI
jgi:uncharacterized SAM-binding protein YcdF (DUF218 family)